MRYVSVCSGIEAATVAWHSLGWKPELFAEIEKFPSRVLAHHYPEVRNVGDFTRITRDDAAADLLVGGTPCQDFSVAGLRAGLDGARGQLTIEFAALAGRLRPRWLVWENVPGVLSIDGGRAFGMFIGELGKLGYGFAYRVLDAQYFGVPQRRRRVFVVGHLGDWRRAAAVFLERHCLSGNPAPSREAGERVAGTIKGGSGCRGYADPSDGNGGGLVRTTGSGKEVFGTLAANAETKLWLGNQEALTGDYHILEPIFATDGQGNAAFAIDAALALNATNEQGYIAFSAKDYGGDAGELSPTLRAGGFDKSHANSGNWAAVAFAQNTRDELREMPYSGALAAEPGMKQQTYLRTGMAVRRLTPRECERLQGFPDDYTKIDAKTADGPRYKALGNSMAVPVMRWIGERIEMVERATA